MARYKKGDWKVKCDLSGAIVNASDCKMMWNGLFVLKKFWRPRHPQETPSHIKDTARPPIARPEPEMTFIEATDVTSDDL